MLSKSAREILIVALANAAIGKEVADAIDAGGGGGQEITGAASSIVTDNLSNNKVLVSNASGKVAASNVSSSELSNLSGLTSNIQDQLDGKVSKSGDSMSGNLTFSLLTEGDPALSSIEIKYDNVHVDRADPEAGYQYTSDIFGGQLDLSNASVGYNATASYRNDGAEIIVNDSEKETTITLSTDLIGVDSYDIATSTNETIIASKIEGFLHFNFDGTTNNPVMPTVDYQMTPKKYVDDGLASKFNNPTGTAADYIAGDGTIIPFPSVAAADRLVTTGYNATGAPIPKMSVVYLDGPQGNLPKMVLAQANNEANSSLTYGITQSAIGNMNSGIIVEAGRLENLNTNIAGWNEGDILYLSPTVPGGITAVRPLAPDQLVFVGVLVRKHPTQGVIQVKIQNGYELDELHNVQISTTPSNGAVLAYDSVTDLWKPNTTKLTKGTKTILCIDNGDYATGQAAIDAATGGDTILFGIKTGGWGDLVIPAGKTLSLVGLNSPRYPGITAQIGSITFSPTTGANPNLNELHLANLYIIAPAGSSAITFGGTAPARLRADGCYIYSNTVTGIVISNTNATFSSAVFQDCEIQSSTSTNTHVTSASRLVTFSRCVFNNGNKAADVTGGILEIGLSRLEVNSASAIVTASSGALAPTYVSLGNCLIYNTTANGSGISLTQGAQSLTFVNVSNVFNILAGTGYCVTGTGTHAYSYPTFAGTNVKFRNTLTNVPLTTTPTLAP